MQVEQLKLNVKELENQGKIDSRIQTEKMKSMERARKVEKAQAHELQSQLQVTRDSWLCTFT